MDFLKATNQQLYNIAFDETERMKDRYAAAKELQERRKNMIGTKCQVPDCTEKGHKTWSMVSMCKEHYEEIKSETSRYYNGKAGMKISNDERVLFQSIMHLIPWSNRRIS